MNCDIIILGGGPTAMGAIQYLDESKGLKTLIISNASIGDFVYHSIRTHYTIDGLFSFEHKKPELLINFYTELIKNKKVDFVIDKISSIAIKRNKFVLSGNCTYVAKYLLIATGMSSVKYKNFHTFKNVSFFAGKYTKRMLNNKVCAVIGGRNSGSAAAIYLSKLCKKVHLLEKKDKLPCKKKYFRKVMDSKNIDVITSVKDININNCKTSNITSIEVLTKNSRFIDLDYVFVYIGLIPNSQLVEHICDVDEQGYIKINIHNETSFENLFAAGDVTGRLSQIIVCHGDGANAIYWIQKKIN